MACYAKTLLDETTDLLENHRGRDKVFKTLCYVSRVIGGLHHDKSTSDKLLYVGKHISSLRLTLQLVDDIALLKYSLTYGLGRHEPNRFLAFSGVTTNIADHLCLLMQKVSWLASHKLVSGIDEEKWSLGSTICWALSSYLSLLRSLCYLHKLRNQKLSLIKNDADSNVRDRLEVKISYETFTAVRMCLDLIFAVNCLPKGCLWGAKFNTWQVGLVAATSSILGIYQMFAKRSLQ